ncbi:recombination regulator RecX [Nocardia mangyaensis]|uniref:recombination regulator RecX n=1 Tax=Nocardia mangyaensis TaxID=2213200 RepID=UPI003F589501
MGSPTSGGRARPDAVDPVEDMRRQLARLGIEVEPEPEPQAESAAELVRSTREQRVEPDVRGIRSGAGDPQRAHPIGFADEPRSNHPNRPGAETESFAWRSADDHEGRGSVDRPRGARRGRRSRRRDEDSLSPGVGGDDGRHADPVAAGSEPGEPERRAGTRRLAPGDRPGATLEQAKDACLRLLAVRARSRAELEKRLGEKGFRLEIIEAALGRLTEVGLIDDAAFAEQWVHARHTYSGKGKKALQRELRDKGVAPDEVEQALAIVTDDAEHARAADLVRRKLRTLPRDLDRDKALRRLVGMLARRGYDQSTAFAVVATELADAGYERTPTPPRPTGPTRSDGRSRDGGTDDPPGADDLPDSAGADAAVSPWRARRPRFGGAGSARSADAVDTSDGTETPGTSGRPARSRPTPGDEQAAIDLVRRKLRSMPADLDRTKAARRLVDLLARRGYSPTLAYAVVKAELAEADR